MLTAHLNGGLANQLFQVAVTYALAWDNSDECAFNLHAPVYYQGNPAITYKDNIFKQVKQLPETWKPSVVYEEPDLNYHPIPYAPNMLLKGYFGSEKYFAHHREKIIKLFKPETINHPDFATLHVRRGDFVKHQNVHVLLPIEYYQGALKLIDSKIVFVVSDDVKWCKDNLKDKRLEFLDQKDWQDLLLISACRCNILANSTFSWWGSWMNENENKVVIAPKKWYTYDICQDIFCKNWILI